MSEIVVETTPSETIIEIEGGPTLTTTVATELQTVVEVPAEPVVIDLNSGARGEPGSAILTGPAYPTMLMGSIGDIYIVTEGNVGAGDVYEKTDTGWVNTGNIRGPAGGIDSVNGQFGPTVTLGKSEIGLPNVDNTSDANKPISTATQAALNTKLGKTGDSYFAGHNPEARILANAYLANDLGNARLRGSTLTVTSGTLSNGDFDVMTDGTGVPAMLGSIPVGSPLVFEFTLPRTLSYGAFLGIAFGSPGWAPKTVRVEAFSEGVWKDVINSTTNVADELYSAIPGNAGVGTTKVRVTLADGVGIRVTHIWGFNYNSDLWSQVIMPRKGGAFYGSISVPSGVINVPTPTAGTDAANKTYVDTKVSLTGNETIAGNKTFSNSLVANAGFTTTAISMTSALTIANPGGNSSIEIGRVDGTANQPFIDFHAGATATDYDARIIVTSGTGTAGFGAMQFIAGSFTFSSTSVISGNGSGLTALNGTQVTTGTVADARLSTNVSLLNAAQTVTGNKTYTGTVVVPTPTLGTHASTKQYVDDRITALVNTSPATLDTLNELAAALGNDPNFATTMTNSLATKVDLTSTQTISGQKTFTATDTYIARVRGNASAPVYTIADRTLGGTAGDVTITRQHTNSGQTNQFHLIDMMQRRAAGTDWTQTQWYQGIGVDTSFQESPTTGTAGGALRTWIRRDPQNQVIGIGSNIAEYLTVSSAVVQAGSGVVFTGNGSGLTALNGTNISTGTVADARLSTNVLLLTGAQTITGAKTVNSDLTMSSTRKIVFSDTRGGVPDPMGLDLGGVFGSNAAGSPANIRLRIHTNDYGLGVSTLRLEYHANAGARHSFYVGGSQVLDVTSAGALSAASFSGSLNGSDISTGTVADARIASTVARLASPAFTGTPTAPTGATTLNDTQIATTAFVKAVILSIYPVGAIYFTAVNTNPGTFIGGTWVAWGTGRVPVGVDTGQTEFNTVEKTGGAKTHTLTIAEMPQHTHVQDAHAHSVYDPGHTHLPPVAVTYGGDAGAYRSIYATNSPIWSSGDGANPMTYASTGIGIYNQTATNQNTGGNASHNNLQPYITCYMWKRTA